MSEIWEQLEEYVVKLFQKRWPGLHRTNRSGGVSGDGDMRASNTRKDMPSPFPLHIDCKYRANNSISCTHREFRKAELEARQWSEIKTPVIVRQIKTGEKFAILKLEDLAELVIELDERRQL